MRSRNVWQLVAALLALLSTVPAFAQGAGGISGIVVDESGGALQGATVKILSGDGITRQSTSTDSSGAFSVDGLSVGIYTVQVEQPLFDVTRVDVQVGSQTTPLRIVLGVAGVRTTVSVAGVGEGYVARRASSATRTDTPLLETPASVQVLTRDLLDDQQTIFITDALKNVPGLTQQFGPYAHGFALRGFRENFLGGFAPRFVEGVRLRSSVPTASLERIEVLKGPASVLFGRAEPGGMVNFVPKEPLVKPYYSVQQQFGSDGLYRTTADATGPLNANGSLRYRLNAEYLNSDSFRDFIFRDALALAPTLAWDISANTSMELEVRYGKDDWLTDHGVPAVGQRPAPIPLSSAFNETNGRGHPESHATTVDVDFRHRFSPALEAQVKLNRSDVDTSIVNVFPLAFNADLNDTTVTATSPTVFGDLTRSGYLEESGPDTIFGSLSLIGRATALGTRHTVLFAVEYYRLDSEALTLRRAAPTINVFNPAFGNIPTFDRLTDADAGLARFIGRDEYRSVLIQDQIDLGPQWHVLLGARYDDTHTLQGLRGALPVDDEHVGPRVGVVYRPRAWLSAYGSYSEAFGSNNALSATGDAFEPESAEQFEVGVKGEWMGGRLTSTLAFFDLTKQNVLTDDPNNPDPLIRVAIGEATSRGIEFDAAGKLTENLTILASYAYLATEITENYDGRTGNELPTAPKNAGSLWAKYEVPGGYSFGAGVFAASSQQIDEANSAQLPGYARVDAFAAYRLPVGGGRAATLQVNVNNVFDRDYYAYANSRLQIFPGAPLTAIGSIRFEF